MRIADLFAYFNWIATNHVSIRSFTIGGLEEILSASIASAEYPALFLEYPEVIIHGEDSSVELLTAITVYTNLEVSDENTIPALDDTEQIMYDIAGKLIHDWKNNVGVPQVESMTMDVVLGKGTDYLHGWRMEVRFRTGGTICYTPSQFGQ